MAHRLLSRIAALTGLAIVAALLSPLASTADPVPEELVYACALKSNGTVRMVDTATACGKNETLVTFKPGPVLLCVQPSGSVRVVSSFSKCKPPATKLTVPPVSGTVYFCAAVPSGVLRWVSDPSQCTASEKPVQITPNDAAPTVTATTPSEGGVVALDADLSVTFSESVSADAGAFALVCGNVAQPVTVTGLPGTTATVDPDADLAPGDACTLTTTASKIHDDDANDPPDTMAANHTLSFTVDARPAVVSTVPTDGASGVSASGNLTVTFSEPVDAGALAFSLTCGGNPQTIVVSGLPGTSATVNPDGDLPGATSCTLTVTGSEITDVDTVDPPDAMSGDHTVTFTTADAAPSVVSTVPIDGAGNVPTNLVISVQWSEPVDVVAGAISVDCGSGPLAGALGGTGTATTTFDPTADLPAGATCSVVVESDDVTDVDGVDPPDNPAGDHSFQFTTDAAPTLQTSTPADGATDIDPSADIVLVFSEAVTVDAGAFSLSCNATPVTVTVGGSGTDTLTLTPGTAAQSASCTLSIDGTKVHDADAFDPPDTMTSSPTISWTTVDLAPSVVSTTPDNGATDVAPGSDITVTFSEAVDVAAGGFTVECPTGSPVTVTVSEGAANVWTLDPDGLLPSGTVCTVTVTGAAVTDDDAVDPPDAMAADHVFSFTVVSNQAPTDLALSPATVAENASTGTVVGALTSTDPDVGDTFTYSLVAGTGDTDNALFAVNGANLEVAGAIDFEAGASLTVRLRTTDAGGLFFEEAVTITVTNVNEAPTDITLTNGTVEENQPGMTPAGTLSTTDPDVGDTHTYTLVAGTGDTDNGKFFVAGNTLQTNQSFNFETTPSLTIRVRTTDAGGLFFEKQLTITVTDANDAPVGVGDSYSGAIGNTLAVVQTTGTGPHKVLTGNVTIANDTDEDATFPHTLSAVDETVTSTGGGTADIDADGSFRFLPGVGDKNQNDTFTYHVTDGSATSAGTVTVAIGTDIVWYVDNSSVGTHDGRSSSPLASFVGINGAGGAGDSDSAGDHVFVYSGAGNYAGGLVLEGNQLLFGQPHGLVVGGTTLVTAGGTNPVITNAAGSGITLASGVNVQGVSVSNASVDGITGTSISTATVGTVTPVPVSGSGADGIDLNGAASGAVSIASAVTTSAGRSVAVSGRSGGTTSFTGAISGKGIELSSNTGATISFTGKLTISTTTTPAFSATGGGTVTTTHAESTLASTTGRGIDVVSTTIGGAGLTFTSVSTNGAPNGIRLSSTGAGGLTVTGNGSTTKGGNASGGTIASSTAAGVSLATASNISLNNLTVSGSPNAPGIDGTGVTNFSFTNGTVTGSGTTSHGALDANIAFNDNGATVNNVSGAVTVSNSVLTNAYQFGVDILNNNGTISNLQLNDNAITSPLAAADSAGSGIRIQELGSGSTVAHLTKGSASGNAITGFPNGAGIVLQGGNAAGIAAPAGNFGTAGAGNAFVISGNAIQGHSLANPMGTNCILVTMPANGTGFVDVTNNGTAGAPVRFNTGNCISLNAFGDYVLTSKVTGNFVSPQSQPASAAGIAFGSGEQVLPDGTLDAAVINLDIQNNTLSSTRGPGIFGNPLNHGTINAKIKNNSVGTPTGATAYGIRVNGGTVGTDTNVCLDVTGNTSAGSPGFTGLGFRKEGAVANINDYGFVGLGPNPPTTAAEMVTYVNGLNPAGGGATSISGTADNFIACTLSF